MKMVTTPICTAFNYNRNSTTVKEPKLVTGVNIPVFFEETANYIYTTFNCFWQYIQGMVYNTKEQY